MVVPMSRIYHWMDSTLWLDTCSKAGKGSWQTLMFTRFRKSPRITNFWWFRCHELFTIVYKISTSGWPLETKKYPSIRFTEILILNGLYLLTWHLLKSRKRFLADFTEASEVSESYLCSSQLQTLSSWMK